jgi:tRNA threonylcarbamoyladenosine biosynthesis protein TsaB
VRILAIETSTRQCSVALAHPEAVVQRTQVAGDRVAECAVSMIADLLADQSLGLDQIDAFAFGSGPGAFTGLRVACGLVQGLAFACDRPVVPVGSLRALAFGAARRTLARARTADVASSDVRCRVMAATDARMGQIYWAVYEGTGAARELAAAALASPAQVAELVARWQPDVIAGDALTAFASAWPAQRGAALWPQLGADASAVAQLARSDLAAGRTVRARDAAPDYVRDQVALTVAQRASHSGRSS